MSDIQEQFTEYVENNPEARAARDAETVRLLNAERAALRARVAELEGALNRAALQIHSALDQLSKHADARDGEDAKVRLSDLHDALIATLAPKEAQ